MDQEKYLETQSQIMIMRSMAENIDTESFLAAVSKAEAVGPLIDPTLYMKAAKSLETIKQCAIAVNKLKGVDISQFTKEAEGA